MLPEIKDALVLASPWLAAAWLGRVADTFLRGRRDVSLARETRATLDVTLRGLPPGASMIERSPDGYARVIVLPVDDLPDKPSQPVVHDDSRR